MKKSVSLFFLLTLVLSSCGSKEVVTEIVDVPALRASSVYDDDSVWQYLETYKEKYKELSESYYKKSVEIQDKDSDKAIYFCKRAITLHPTLELYNALGTLLVKAKQYDEAHELYQFIVDKHYLSSTQDNIYVFSEPSEDMRYESIALNFLRFGYVYGYDVYQYREAGLDVKKLGNRLLRDDRLKIDTTLEQYKNFKILFMTEEEIEEYKYSEQVFNGFLESITDTSSTFEINAKQVQTFKYSSREYADEMYEDNSDARVFYLNFLQEKKENPNGWYDYNYNHIYAVYPNINAIVYAIDTSATACPIEMRHIYHRLVLYNEKGEVLDHKIIAYQSGEDLATAIVNQGDIAVKFYKRKWRNPYNKKDFDNDLLSVEEAGSIYYKINAQGKIEQRGDQAETAPTSL